MQLLCKAEKKYGKKWEIIYDAIKDIKAGEMLTFDKLKIITGLDLQKNRDALYRANKKLILRDKKMLRNIKGKGYKIAYPAEQLEYASNRKERAYIQLEKGKVELLGINKKGLTKEQRTLCIHLINHFQTTALALKNQSVVALKKTQDAVRDQEENIAVINNLQEQLASLKARLV